MAIIDRYRQRHAERMADELDYDVAWVDAATDQFGVSGNHEAAFPVGIKFIVSGSTGNDGTWTVSVAGSYSDDLTKFTVSEDITSGVADGTISIQVRPTLIAVGAGFRSDGEVSKRTALVTEIAREPITARWLTGGNIARVSAVFTTGVGNGTWTEIGLFNAPSGGDMLVRDENASGFCTKTSTQVKVVVGKLRIA